MLSLLKFGHFLFLVLAVSAIYLYNIILPNALPSPALGFKWAKA